VPGVQIPIIDQLAHPSFSLVTRVAIGGTISGDGTLAPPQNPLVALTYGFSWAFFTVPVHYGRILGNPDQFDPPLMQLSVDYTDLGGHVFTKQIEWQPYDGSYYWWEDPLPTALRYHILPGVVVTPFWLQT
jgi:hypothetical protein